MMPNDLIAALTNCLTKEYNDAIMYMELSKKANNFNGTAQILRDIAFEEYTHACHLENILRDENKLNENSELKEKAHNAVIGI